MAIDCLLWLLQDPSTCPKVIDKAIPALVDLAAISTPGDHKKLGDSIVNVLQECIQSQGAGRNSINSHAKEEWLKLEGNSLFSSGDISGATSKYSEALALCPMRSKKERVVLYSNRAQCHLLLQKPWNSISDAMRALSIHNLSTDPDLSSRQNKVPDYADCLVKKQMRAAWLFKEAAIIHGDVQCEGDAADTCGRDTDDSEWDTASESDVGSDGRDELDDDNSEWKNNDERKDKFGKAATKDMKHGYNLLLTEDYDWCFQEACILCARFSKQDLALSLYM
ncbi:ARM-repeat/Tetratricopeptide repeat (TPR)-like protein [Abeliophyllum distichum]|uniref:ARM-repeat/Tetratricopeptide repeat (TPR)-like protein n=1 Tax=Abeliophyllum distichum TaxID=126358 RepID=A0ABD1SST2_9LAMI